MWWQRGVEIPPGRVQDPFEKNVPGLGRDPARSPMQWDASPGYPSPTTTGHTTPLPRAKT
jgi:hypothetical protein